MESEVHKRLKENGKVDENKIEMKRLFRDIFNKVNDFEKEYYNVLINMLKAIEDSTEKYYDEIIKFYEIEG